MRSVCVFCGSSLGQPAHVEAAESLGRALAENMLEVIYGGGKVGLMGVIADAALKSGGRVVGVIPQFLIDLEVVHNNLSELVVVQSMHERKAEMASRADAFVALPGGFGTLEEFFEVLTWLQLGLHNKLCILLNVDEFFTPLLDFLRLSQRSGFISAESFAIITVCSSIEELISLMMNVSPHTGLDETLI